MADLNVTVAFLLENQEEIAKELERVGGIAGQDFGKSLSAEAQKKFNDLISAAEKAAKEVGFKFNKQKLQFETVRGDVIPADVIARIQKINPAFKQATEAVNTFKSAVVALEGQSRRSFNLLEAAVSGVAFSLANTLTNSATSVAGIAGNLINNFMALDGELRLAAAAAGEIQGYQRLASIVDQVGIEAAGTTKQVAELATSLVRAGFSVSEVERALPGVVRGAEATGTGFEQFGSIVGNTLRAFTIDTKDVGRVVDVLTQTVNSSNAQVEDFGYTMQYAAPLANTLGVSLEDLATAIGLLANAGIKGSVAGTGLREFLQKLQQSAGGASPEILGLSRDSDRLVEAMQRLGASVLDTKGNLLPLDDVFIQLKRSLDGLSKADQIQLVNVLFGDQAGNKILAITNQTEASIKKMSDEIKNSKGSADIARDAMTGFGLELKKLQGTIGSIGNKIGETFAAGLRPLLNIANSLAGALAGLPDPIKTTGAVLIGLGAAGAAAAVGLGLVQVALAQVGGFAVLKTAIAGAAATIFGPFAASTAVVIALGVAVGYVTGQFTSMDATTKRVIVTVGSLGVAIATAIALSNASVITANLAGVATIIQLIILNTKAWIIATKGQTIAQFALNTVQYGMASIVGIISRVIDAYKAWRAATTAVAGVTAALQVLVSGPAGLAQAALAVGAGVAAYAALNGMIQETGQSTQQLTEEQRNLQTEIDSTKQMISEQSELGLSTDDAEKRLAALELKKAGLSEPLALSVEIDDAQNKLKALEEQLKKTKDGSGKESLDAQVQALKLYKDFLQAVQNNKGLDKLPESIQQGGKELQSLSRQIFALLDKQVKLPLTATADRAAIDRQISELQKQLDEKKIKIRLEIEQQEIGSQLTELAKKKTNLLNNGASTEEINTIDKERERLLLLQAKNQRELIGAQKASAAVAKELVQSDKNKIDILKAQQAEEEAAFAKKVASGSLTKSQAEEELRLSKLLTLEEEKRIKVKQFAALSPQAKTSDKGLELKSEIAGIDKQIADLKTQGRESAIEKEIALIKTQKVEYDAYLTKLKSTGAITKNQYENELRYMDRVAMERERSIKVNKLNMINDPSDKEALQLRQEIAAIDKSIAQNKIDTATAAYEKAKEEVDIQKQKLEIASQEIDLNRQSQEVSKSYYESALQYAQALLDNVKARQELVQSEYALASAFKGQQLQSAESRLSMMQEKGSGASKGDILRQEQDIKRIKQEAAQIALAAKQAELEGLGQQERIEFTSLRLKQQMAAFDQQGRIAQSEMNRLKQQQLMIELQVKLKDPNNTAAQKQAIREQIAIQSQAIRLADQQINSEKDRLGVLKDINRVETDTLSKTQQARRNRTYADYVSAGGRYAGGPVDPSFAYTVNELGKESFLTSTGRISWIEQAPYATWRPPSRGMVIPAGISQQLAEIGILPSKSNIMPLSKSSVETRFDRISEAISIGMKSEMVETMQRQTVALTRLHRSIKQLTNKDWSVNVTAQSGQGMFRTLQAI